MPFRANNSLQFGFIFSLACVVVAGWLLAALAVPAWAVEATLEPVPEAAPDCAIKESGFEPLLGANAKALWRGYKSEGWPAGWQLDEGVLARVGGGDDLMTADEFADFDLRLEWKISPAGNSGILYRVSTDAPASYFTGMECQILDDDAHKDGGDTLTSASSLYGMYARSSKATVPVGEWNEVRIVVEGNHVEHWLNGKKMVECEIGSADWNRRLAKSKFAEWPKYAKNRQGHIALQDHNDLVWYRNIRIKRLSEAK